MPGFFFIKNTCGDRVARKRLKSERGNKFGGMAGHDDLDVETALGEAAREVSGFVASDGAGHAQDDIFFHEKERWRRRVR